MASKNSKKQTPITIVCHDHCTVRTFEYQIFKESILMLIVNNHKREINLVGVVENRGENRDYTHLLSEMSDPKQSLKLLQ